MSKKLSTDPEVLEQEQKETKTDAGQNSDKQEASADKEQQDDSLEEKLKKENEELRKELEKLQRDSTVKENRSSVKSRKKKKVKIQVPYDYKHKDDLTVGLNGKMYRFQRGKTVEVDEDVAEIIERSLEQDLRTDEMIRDLVEEAEKKSN